MIMINAGNNCHLISEYMRKNVVAVGNNSSYKHLFRFEVILLTENNEFVTV